MRRFLALSLLFGSLLIAAPLAADNDAAPPKGEANTANGEANTAKGGGGQRAPKGVVEKKAARLPGITAGREAAVMTFVREHHPELEALLVYLKKNRSADFERAFRDLFAVSERLARVQEQDEPRYELELARWKLQSRIQLLVARLKMEKSDELRAELREALAEQIDVDVAIAQREQQRLLERLERLAAKIERLNQDKDRDVETKIRLLTQPVRKTAPAGAAKVSTDATDKQDDNNPPRTSAPK